MRLSFTELNTISNQLARGIVSVAGPKNGDGDFVVAVQLPPGDGLIATLLAIWKAGAAYLPVDVAAPSHRIQHMIDEAKPSLVITNTPDGKRSFVLLFRTINDRRTIIQVLYHNNTTFVVHTICLVWMFPVRI